MFANEGQTNGNHTARTSPYFCDQGFACANDRGKTKKVDTAQVPIVLPDVGRLKLQIAAAGKSTPATTLFRRSQFPGAKWW